MSNELQLTELEQILESTLQDDILKDVLFLGLSSKNDREYTVDALTEAIGLYNDKPIYIDHSNTERKLTERFGTSENARMVPGKGIVGDIRVLTSHPLFAIVKESYEKRTPSIGISQNAVGMGEVNNQGKTVISKIMKVISLDLVSGAATVKNLRESENVELVALTEQVKTLTTSNTDLINKNKELVEKVNLMEQEINNIKDKAGKWQMPVSQPLTESKKVERTPAELAKWLIS